MGSDTFTAGNTILWGVRYEFEQRDPLVLRRGEKARGAAAPREQPVSGQLLCARSSPRNECSPLFYKGRMIPRVVHFIWLQGREHLAAHRPECIRYQRAWRKYLDDYEYRFWSEEELDALIERRRPRLLPHFRNEALPAACRTDVARLVVLEAHGGIYSDAGNRPFRRLSVLRDACAGDAQFVHVQCTPLLGNLDGSIRANNALMAATPGSSVVCAVLDHAEDFVAKNPPGKSVGADWVIHFAGPKAVSACLQRLLPRDDIVSLPEVMMDASNMSSFHLSGSISSASDEELRKRFPDGCMVRDGRGSWMGGMRQFGERLLVAAHENWLVVMGVLLSCTLILAVTCVSLYMRRKVGRAPRAQGRTAKRTSH